jgi:hypothetical protein
MRKKNLEYLIIIAFILLFDACDQFSLSDVFRDNGDLSLSLQRNVVQQSESIALYPAGGTGPYSYAVMEMENDLSYVGDTASEVSCETNIFTAGNSIGKVTIRLLDAGGKSIDSFVIIRPPAVQSFAVNGVVITNEIEVRWIYTNNEMIDSFRIERSIGGSPFITIASPVSGFMYFKDSGLNPNFTYTYKIYAVSGEFLSKASPPLSAKPRP